MNICNPVGRESLGSLWVGSLGYEFLSINSMTPVGTLPPINHTHANDRYYNTADVGMPVPTGDPGHLKVSGNLQSVTDTWRT
jgi:hypothetical protein